jgi:hypothetical protein
MLKRVLVPLALLALALPAAAAAKTYDVSGTRLGLLGRGDVQAELTATDATKPVRIATLGGSLTITPLSADVTIHCKSRANGAVTTSCDGKAVMAIVTGSHFAIHASAKIFMLAIPRGYTGSVDAATARQCGRGGFDCRATLKALRKGGTTTAPATTPATGAITFTAEPGTQESLDELAAALKALGN